MRLGWRALTAQRMWLLAILGGIVWIGLHAAGYILIGRLDQGQALPPTVWMVAGAMFWFFASITIAQTVAHAVAALFDRGDLDLLLSSPLSPRTVFFVRGAGIALGAGLLPAFALFPFANAGLLHGRPGMLGIYLVVASLAMAAAGTGMALTMALVRLFGARRAKTIAQIAGALIGAGFFLLSQAQNFLPIDTRTVLLAWAQREMQPGGWLAPDSALWWPARAMVGEVLPLAVTFVAGVGWFLLVVDLTYRRFAQGAQEAVAGGRPRALAAGRAAAIDPAGFRGGLARIMVLKEWRLLLRDPQIISQTLLQVLYMVPIMFVGFRGERNVFFVMAGLVVIASMLASNLAWLTIAAEDAPELLGTAPVGASRVRWTKAAAAVIPVCALLLPAVLWLSVRAPAVGAALAICGLGGMLSAALAHIWNPRPGSRANLKSRHRQGALAGLLEVLGAMAWAGAGFAALRYWPALPAALALALANPAAAWFLGRDVRQRVLG